MADWIVTTQAERHAFSEVRHVHPNGTMVAVRDHTPEVVKELRGTPIVRSRRVVTLDRRDGPASPVAPHRSLSGSAGIGGESPRPGASG